MAFAKESWCRVGWGGSLILAFYSVGGSDGQYRYQIDYINWWAVANIFQCSQFHSFLSHSKNGKYFDFVTLMRIDDYLQKSILFGRPQHFYTFLLSLFHPFTFVHYQTHAFKKWEILWLCDSDENWWSFAEVNFIWPASAFIHFHTFTFVHRDAKGGRYGRYICAILSGVVLIVQAMLE